MNNEPELVDLGLPSGNLWFKCNLGAESELEYGNYYQWGSIVGYQGDEALKHSSWDTCPFTEGKYNFDEEYFKVNRYKWIYKNNNLKSDFDIVTQTYGEGYKIPDPKDFKELKKYTTATITLDGAKGRLITSKINGNSIFIPFSGCILLGQSCGISQWGYLWLNKSGEKIHSKEASGFFFGSSLFYESNKYKCYAFPIRGIKVKNE